VYLRISGRSYKQVLAPWWDNGRSYRWLSLSRTPDQDLPHTRVCTHVVTQMFIIARGVHWKLLSIQWCHWCRISKMYKRCSSFVFIALGCVIVSEMNIRLYTCLLLCPTPRVGALSDDARLTSVWRLSVCRVHRA